MSGSFCYPVLQFIDKHGLATAVFGLIVTLVAFFYRHLARFIARLAKWLWAKMRGRGAYRSFEQSYLDWLIGEHRHLGILPAQSLARRWRERRKFVGLENVFVSLSITTQSGDERRAETYGHGENSWRKRPWIGLRFIRYLARRPLLSALLKRILIPTEQTYQPGDLGLVVDRHKQLVIRGEPGS